MPLKHRLTVLPCLLLMLGTGFAEADVVRGRWYFGPSLAYYTTSDFIRSNAGDPSDPRPSLLDDRETTIQDGLYAGLTIGFGLTDRISLQMDVGRFDADVAPVQVFLRDTFPLEIPQVPGSFSRWRDREETIPVSAGRILELPVTLSGTIRFRQDRPLNIYLGAGMGYIFSELDQDKDIRNLNSRLSSLRIRALFDAAGAEVTPEDQKPLKGDGRVPFIPVRTTVDDSFEWHLAAGVEYFFNPRSSLVVDLRHRFASQDLKIRVGDYEQLSFFIFSEELFRQDGSVKIFNEIGAAPNPFINSDPSQGRVRCTAGTVGDFDNDGHADDRCYPFNLQPSGQGNDEPDGVFLVQGGKIDLSGYTLAVSLRFYF